MHDNVSMFLLRFGGGSNLVIKGDKNGIWTILMKGTRYVASVDVSPLADPVFSARSATFFANVP